MNKPITILCEDFKSDLTCLINNCGLHASIIELVLQNYLNSISSIVNKQTQIDREKYEYELMCSQESKQ